MFEDINEGSLAVKHKPMNSVFIKDLNALGRSAVHYQKGDISVPEMLLSEPFESPLKKSSSITKMNSVDQKFPSATSGTLSFFKRESKLDLKTSEVGKILIVDDERFNCDIIAGFLMVLNVEYRDQLTEFAYNGE